MRGNKRENALVRSSREIVYISTMTAVLIAAQFALAAVQGVEVVTVLLLAFCVACGVYRGVLVAVAFSCLRCILFGFFPNVLVLYLVYYSLFAVVFGLLGKSISALAVPWRILILTVCATVFTCGFTMLDDIITPWMLGYTAKSARAYFYASLIPMAVQCVCAAVSVALLWYPLGKAFARFPLRSSRKL